MRPYAEVKHMEVIKNILINYWPQILAGVIFIASFILQLVGKRPVKDIESYLYKLCTEAVKLAETTDKKGNDKLSFAIGLVFTQLQQVFPKLDVKKYFNVIQKIIEDILSTPQKKL